MEIPLGNCRCWRKRAKFWMPHFHCASLPLARGSIIEPGNWGRIIRNAGWPHNLSGRETILEHVRATQYSHKPSRFEAAFFFDDENEALFYANSDGRQITMITYEVELLSSAAPQHTADWRNVAASGSLDLKWASNYWSGQMLPMHADGKWNAACREVVAITAMKILRRL